ncbi:MAG TPA: signal recognition particle protein Srp54 [Candidatus Methanofastidiosa archaeon]|nr:signal recognition particle protein Srp54 [Candidatus Methanofastidiosa archaeon]HPR41269.1 signal recognition particle protein Srp54 [Candidatus Methanofastidiosa archaeon]
MALESLSEALNGALKKITKSSVVDKETIKEVAKDIQRALLVADVNVQLVLEVTKNIENRAMDEKLPPGVSRKEHIIKIVYEEITKFMGDKAEKIELRPPGETTVLLMVGIQGSGKTTTTGKLARYYQKKGFKVGTVCTDTWRPGAFSQLQQYLSKFNLDVWGDPDEKDAIKLAKEGVKRFKEKKYDIIIVDTAGRHKEERGLIDEMREIADVVRPDETILVIDGTIGQQAKNQAEAFKEATKLGSIIITKLDGSAKGGGALSAVAATGAPIKFIGEGERIENLEPFEPERFVAKLLGFGDLKTLLDKVGEASKKQDLTKDDAKRMMSGKFTLKDMYQQLEMLSNMGPLQQIFQMIPGMGGNVPKEFIEASEGNLAKYRIIMDSMNEKELRDPKIVHFSRIKRIAKGSGTKTDEVKALLHQYDMMKKMMKTMNKRKLGGMLSPNMFKNMKMQ